MSIRFETLIKLSFAETILVYINFQGLFKDFCSFSRAFQELKTILRGALDLRASADTLLTVDAKFG